MRRKAFLGGLVLTVLFTASLYFHVPSGLTEELTITTYYPSPVGSYSELQSKKLSVGDTDRNGILDAADLPRFEGNIRLLPQTGSVASWGAGRTGEIAYSSAQDSLYHYNGSSWTTDGGGGGGEVSYTHYCFISGKGTPVCINYGGSRKYCPSGYTQKLALGSWGYCNIPGQGHFFLPPGCSCGSGFGTAIIGDAYVCSK
jgi:hypothetical protein